MIFRKSKKLTAVALSAALMVSAVSMSASAITLDTSGSVSYSAPTSTMTVDSTILSGATAAANTTLMSILGINVTSTDAAGVYNSAGTNGQTTPINLQIFGSDWNSSPDPYYYNFYYNLVYNTDDGTTVGDCHYVASDDDPSTSTSFYDSWTGAYTLIYSANKSGPSGGASSTLMTLIVNGSTVKNTNPAFYYQPDVLFSGATLNDVTDATDYDTTAYNNALDAYNTANSTNYSPLITGGWNTSQYCANTSADGFGNIKSMAKGIQAIASAIESNTDKSGRYGDISDIANQLYAFSVGVHEYAVNEENDYTYAVYCVDPTYNSDGTVTVKAASGRYAQYLDGLGTDLYDEAELTSETATMSVSAFATLVNKYGAVVFSNSTSLGVTCVPMPTTVYGMTMQSADNMLGVAYCFGALYGDDSEDSEIPTYLDMLAYWVTYFYHVKSGNLNDAMSLMLGETITSSDYHSTTFTTLVNSISGYTGA